MRGFRLFLVLLQRRQGLYGDIRVKDTAKQALYTYIMSADLMKRVLYTYIRYAD